MRFNYMLPKTEQMRKCPDGRQHYYVHTSHMEAVIGHIAVRFRCKYCGELATAFLDNEKYKINEHLLTTYGA